MTSFRKAADVYEKSGVPLSSAFAKYTSVDPQVVHMLAIGERSASLDTQLQMLSEMFEEDADQLMDDFSQFISLVVMIIAVMLIAGGIPRNLYANLHDGAPDDARGHVMSLQ